MPALIGAAFVAALLAAVVASASSSPAPLMIGPSDISSNVDKGGLSCGQASQLDCAFFNLSDNHGASLQAPADGTITSWSAGGLEGTGRLLVIRPVAGGRYEIVAKSAEETEPCIPGIDNDCGGFTKPGPQYTFATDIPIKAGDLVGIELISPSGCWTNSNPQSQGCGFIGSNQTQTQPGTATFWNQTPALGAPTAPTSANPLGAEVLVQAVEQPTSLTGLQQNALARACQAAAVGASASSVLQAGGYNVTLGVNQPGQLTGAVTYEGSSGSSVLVYDGSSGGSVLVYEGSGGTSTVLVYEGSSGGSVLVYDGSGGGSTVAADTATTASTALRCTATFNAGTMAPARDVAAARGARAITICLHKTGHLKARCVHGLHRVALPAVATVTRRFAHAGTVKLHLALTRFGRLLLTAAKAQAVLYHHRHPHSKSRGARLKLVLRFTPTAR